MLYVIAMTWRKTRKEEKPTGFKVFSSQDMMFRNIDFKDFMAGLLRGVKVENVYLDNKTIVGNGFDIEELPSIIYKSGEVDKIRDDYKKTLVRHGQPDSDNEYLLVSASGLIDTYNASFIEKKLGAGGGILNVSEYVPSSSNLQRRNNIVELLRKQGCSEIDITEHNLVNNIKVPDGCNLILFDNLIFTKDKCIKSSTGYIASLEIRHYDINENKEARAGLSNRLKESNFDTPVQLKIDKLIIRDFCNVKYIRDLSRYIRNEIHFAFRFNEINSAVTINELIGPFHTRLIDRVMDGEIRITTDDNNKINIKNYYEIISKLEFRCGLGGVKHITDLRELTDKTNCGGLSVCQIKADRSIEAIKGLLDTDLYNKLKEFIMESTDELDDVIKRNTIQEYSKYGGYCVKKEGKLVQFDINKSSRTESNIVNCLDTSDYTIKEIDKNEYYVDCNMDDYSIENKIALMGINTSIKDDTVYCVLEYVDKPIKDKQGNIVRYRKVFKSAKNMSILEVVSMLRNDVKIECASFANYGGYLMIESLTDIVVYREDVIKDLIAKNMNSQTHRVIELNNMLERYDYTLTELGLLTSYDSTKEGIINIPKGTKEIGYRAIKIGGKIDKMILPKGIKPITFECLEKVLFINELIVNDKDNAIGAFKFAYRLEKDNGIKGVKIINYNVDGQKELAQALGRLWDKKYFLNCSTELVISEVLDTKYSNKLMSAILKKCGLTSLIGLMEDYSNGHFESADKEKLKVMGEFLDKVHKSIDVVVYNTVINIIQDYI